MVSSSISQKETCQGPITTSTSGPPPAFPQLQTRPRGRHHQAQLHPGAPPDRLRERDQNLHRSTDLGLQGPRHRFILGNDRRPAAGPRRPRRHAGLLHGGPRRHHRLRGGDDAHPHEVHLQGAAAVLRGECVRDALRWDGEWREEWVGLFETFVGRLSGMGGYESFEF